MNDKVTRARTTDRGAGPPERITITTTSQIGPKRHMLPNGFLLCEDVPIARAGWMFYGPGEVPLTPSNGRIYVERTHDELFRPETIGSFMACPVVDEHPKTLDGVTPDNWKELAGGFSTTNVRQGTGADADVLLADLVISRKDLISAVMAGKREVSCGYDADYVQTSPGEGVQKNIVGNHIALVERGRCGPRCAIGDRESPHQPEEGNEMPQVKPGATPRRHIDPAVLATLQGAVASLTGPDNEEGGDGNDDGAVHVHVHTHDGAATRTGDGASTTDADDRIVVLETGFADMQKTLSAIAVSVEKLAANPGRTQDGAPGGEGAGDSKALETSYKDLQSKCEILVPGFKVQTFDAAATRASTVDRMCSQRKRALEMVGATTEGSEFLTSISGDAELDVSKLDCGGAALLFNAAAAAKASANNRAHVGDGKLPTDGAPPLRKGPPSIASINEANDKYWAEQRNTQVIR